MDIDKYLEPEFDFSKLDPDHLRMMGNVTTDDLEYVIHNRRTCFHDDYPLKRNQWAIVGFTSRAQCLFMLLRFQQGKYCFLDIKPADKYDIEQLWCGRL